MCIFETMDFLYINDESALALVTDREILTLSTLGYEFFELCLDQEEFNSVVEGYKFDHYPIYLPNKWAMRMFQFIDLNLNEFLGTDPDGLGLMSALNDIKYQHELELMSKWN